MHVSGLKKLLSASIGSLMMLSLISCGKTVGSTNNGCGWTTYHTVSSDSKIEDIRQAAEHNQNRFENCEDVSSSQHPK